MPRLPSSSSSGFGVRDGAEKRQSQGAVTAQGGGDRRAARAAAEAGVRHGAGILLHEAGHERRSDGSAREPRFRPRIELSEEQGRFRDGGDQRPETRAKPVWPVRPRSTAVWLMTDG